HYRTLDRDLFSVEGNTIGVREEDRWGADFFLGQHIARLGLVSGGIRIGGVELEDKLRGTSEQLNLRTLHFEAQLENFDRANFPTSGNRHHVQLELAGRLLGGDVDYTKFTASLEAYYPLLPRLTYHPRLRVGLSRQGLPSSEKFYVGGMASFWGFRVDELSGDKLVLMNHELRVRLPLRLYLAARLDVGDVYTSTESIRIDNLRSGIGGWLAFDSPIGPLKVGFGGGNSEKDHVYFTAGMRF
ncbi:BamA/TamA family outer membrane protein, partial [candidate division GN15 bacterium]|nr:BamA/TamA family outer membrane protein [candidate division GN15 bacterium]